MTDTPELDKQHALNEPRPPFDVLSQFWDWLEANGYVLAKYGAPRQRRMTCPVCRGRCFDVSGLTPRQQQLLRSAALPDSERDPCPRCAGEGTVWEEVRDEDSLMEAHASPTRLFAEFWGLDLDKIESERRAILEELRQVAPRRCRNCMGAHGNEGHYCDTCIGQRGTV